MLPGISPRTLMMVRSKSKQMAGLKIASPNYDEERRSVSSAVKFIRARGIAEEEAKKQIEKLNQLMSKRMKRETSATIKLRDMHDERIYKYSQLDERRSAAKSRVSQRNQELEQESLRSYTESLKGSKSPAGRKLGSSRKLMRANDSK